MKFVVIDQGSETVYVSELVSNPKHSGTEPQSNHQLQG